MKTGAFVWMSAALIIASACALQSGQTRKFTGKGLTTGAPGMNVYPSAGPGETKVLPRPYNGAPPLIPHAVADLTISRSTNDCMECHLEGAELSDGHVATKIPRSHHTNPYRNESQDSTVVGARYLCLQCHTTQSDATPPVGQIGK